jgi:DNA-binding transcriptional regulator YdaS (Cro superfamily)
MDTFHSFFKALSKDEREAFAKTVGTSVAYLWQIIYKQRRCSESLAIEISKASKGSVHFGILRPDVDWAYVRNSAQSILEDSIDEVDRVESSDDVQPPAGTSGREKYSKMAP